MNDPGNQVEVPGWAEVLAGDENGDGRGPLDGPLLLSTARP